MATINTTATTINQDDRPRRLFGAGGNGLIYVEGASPAYVTFATDVVVTDEVANEGELDGASGIPVSGGTAIDTADYAGDAFVSSRYGSIRVISTPAA